MITKCTGEFELACEEKCYLDVTSNKNCSLANSMQYLGRTNPKFPSEDYWFHSVLQRSDSIDETGSLIWQLVLVLGISWTVCFLFLFRGVQMSGKIVYVVSLLPYFILLVLGAFSFTYNGAVEGITYLFTPKTEYLWEIDTWRKAAGNWNENGLSS